MNKIYNNTNYQNLNINNNQNIYQTNVNAVSKENSVEKINSTDSIEINEKNENIINTRKAYDAFKDTCSDFGYMPTSTGGSADMSLWYGIVVDQMKSHGIVTPSFIPDGKNNNDFLPFIDKLKDFAKNLNETNPSLLPDKFFDFCDSYKEKLMQYGCK